MRWICFLAAPTLFSASDDEAVKQWDLESNSCIRSLQGHSSSVICLAATVDAERLLSGDRSGSVLLWDITTGQQLASVKAHSRCVSCLAVTPDGSSFVSGSWDSSLKLWRFDALQQPVIQFSGLADNVNACVVSLDGKRLYSEALIRAFACGIFPLVSSWQACSHTQVKLPVSRWAARCLYPAVLMEPWSCGTLGPCSFFTQRAHSLVMSEVSQWALVTILAFFLAATVITMCACGTQLLELSLQDCRDTQKRFLISHRTQMVFW